MQSLKTFKKAERLCSHKLIEELFASGTSFQEYPVRTIWKEIKDLPSDYPAQLAIGVPKRNIKKAVERNRIKRIIREAYRKNKSILYDYLNKRGKKIALMFIYTAKTELPYAEIESKIILTLQRLTQVDEKLA